MVREDVAIALNNSALDLFNQRGPQVGDRVGEILERARKLSTDEATRDTIDRNQRSFDELTELVEFAKRQARQLAAVGRVGQARRGLMFLRRRLTDVPGVAAEIDQLLQELGGSYGRGGVTHDRPSRVGRAVAIVVMVVVAVVAFLWGCDPDDSAGGSSGPVIGPSVGVLPGGPGEAGR